MVYEPKDDNTVPTLSSDVLTDFATRLFEAVRVPSDEAEIVASSLVGANLRGHDSHGVMRIPQYVGFVEKGEYQPGAELVIEQETPAVVVADGGWGFGQVQAHRLLDRVLPKAMALGIAAGVAKRFGHTGRLGEYAERAAASGLVLIATVNNAGAGQRVAPPGGIAPRLGTNPLCAGVPTSERADRARLRHQRGRRGESPGLPHQQAAGAGGLVARQRRGRPTTDPSVLYQEPLGSILPMGGVAGVQGLRHGPGARHARGRPDRRPRRVRRGAAGQGEQPRLPRPGPLLVLGPRRLDPRGHATGRIRPPDPPGRRGRGDPASRRPRTEDVRSSQCRGDPAERLALEGAAWTWRPGWGSRSRTWRVETADRSTPVGDLTRPALTGGDDPATVPPHVEADRRHDGPAENAT